MRPKSGKKSQAYSTTLSSRGQVVLPAGVRRKLGLRKGTRMSIEVRDERVKSMVLRPVEGDVVRELRGILKDGGEALQFLQQERRRDRERGR